MYESAELQAKLHVFIEAHREDASEEQQGQGFWTELLRTFGVDESIIRTGWEYHVSSGGRIDWLWIGCILHEMKSHDKSLEDAMQQAKLYYADLPENERSLWIITSNFTSFLIQDMRTGETYTHSLEDLLDNRWMQFWKGMLFEEEARLQREYELNLEASERISHFYESIPEDAKAQQSEMEWFLVRLLFCLFAEDTGIFNIQSFTQLIQESRPDGRSLKSTLQELFEQLDTEIRGEHYHEFPYVNGKLFEGARVPFEFNAEMRNRLLSLCDFKWEEISPVIFGSIFQTAMKSAKQRQEGVHYTAEEHILRVMRPLFLDDLNAAFAEAQGSKQKLRNLQQKIGNLRFLDPACGCGNFLIVAYRELRKLELRIMLLLNPYQPSLSFNGYDGVVRMDSFAGIELNPFAAHIAQVAMWLTDHQMNLEFAEAYHHVWARLPLADGLNIHCGNALTMDWNEVCAVADLDYILGNPPFVGKQYQTDLQKQEIQTIFAGMPRNAALDYVTCWYEKTCQMLQPSSKAQVAFVSTNSITQGQQVYPLWSRLVDRYGVEIVFAYRSFQWTTELSKKQGAAAVYCVIIGWQLPGAPTPTEKRLYTFAHAIGEPTLERLSPNAHINPYLRPGKWVRIQARTNALVDVPPLVYGNKPTDNGLLSKLSPEEAHAIVTSYPEAAPYVRPLLGAQEMLNTQWWAEHTRYCLWLVDMPPDMLRRVKPIYQRVQAVQAFRKASSKPKTVLQADVPFLFDEVRHQTVENTLPWIAIPSTSSEGRQWIPLAFVPAEVIPNNSMHCVYAPEGDWGAQDAMLGHFGVLQSRAHMVWVQTFCGRLKGDFRYSKDEVYNNFPFVTPFDADAQDPKHRRALWQAIREAAQQVLDTRERLSGTLADLYDQLSMPHALRKAHETLDRAVDTAYGLKGLAFDDAGDAKRLEALLKRYQALENSLYVVDVRAGKRRKRSPNQG